MDTLRKHVQSFARYAGFATVCFEWLAIILFFVAAPQYFTGEHPISKFATLPETRVAFAVCYSGAALCFWIFANYHLKKHYRTPVKIFALSMLTMAGVALVPYNMNDVLSSVAHSTLATVSFTTFFVGMALMAHLSKEVFFRVFTYLAVVLGAVATFTYVSLIDTGSLFLSVSELTIIFACQIWTIWISVRAYKKASV